MAVDNSYDDILNRSFDDLQDDKLLPDGKWLLRLKGASIKLPQNEGQNIRVNFIYEPVEPQDDVDEDELAELGEDYDWSQNVIFYTVFVENDRDWKNIQRHLRRHKGVDFSAGNGTIQGVLKKGVRGSEVYASLGQRTYENNFGELQTANTATNFEPLD